MSSSNQSAFPPPNSPPAVFELPFAVPRELTYLELHALWQERFDELEVNRRLRGVYGDVAALRRHLVDEGFLSRGNGVYWRSGGTVDLGDGEDA